MLRAVCDVKGNQFYLCFVIPEKAHDRLTRQMCCSGRCDIKWIQDVLIGAAMIPYKEVMMRLSVDCKW